MKFKTLWNTLMTGLLILIAGHSPSALAYYSGGGVLDAAGNNASATDLATVNCFDDGHGEPHHFSAAVQDQSQPVPGLLVSLHIFKLPSMTTVTDTVSGDGNWSDIATVVGGPGTYYLSIRKTAAGARTFFAGWECQTINNVGTGTEINVLQMQ
jgi:hypothetical protein